MSDKECDQSALSLSTTPTCRLLCSTGDELCECTECLGGSTPRPISLDATASELLVSLLFNFSIVVVLIFILGHYYLHSDEFG